MSAVHSARVRRGVIKARRISSGLMHDPRSMRYARRWIASQSRGRSPLRDGIPWIPFRAAGWLDARLCPDMTVFEWGSGGSTIWLAGRVAHVTSIEHDPAWYDAVAAELRRRRITNVTYRLIEPSSPAAASQPDAYASSRPQYRDVSFERYVTCIDEAADRSFDLTAVDGRARLACIAHGIPKTRPGGWLMLDNAERAEYADAARGLEDAPRVDFYGLAPHRLYSWQTSFWQLPR